MLNTLNKKELDTIIELNICPNMLNIMMHYRDKDTLKYFIDTLRMLKHRYNNYSSMNRSFFKCYKEAKRNCKHIKDLKNNSLELSKQVRKLMIKDSCKKH